MFRLPVAAETLAVLRSPDDRELRLALIAKVESLDAETGGVLRRFEETGDTSRGFRYGDAPIRTPLWQVLHLVDDPTIVRFALDRV